jgi:hypothetical protein
MHTVELLEEALKTAHSLGYLIRQDWLGGSGGACEIKGKRWLFVDLSLPPLEQLDQVLSAIHLVSNERTLMAPSVRRALDTRKAA